MACLFVVVGMAMGCGGKQQTPVSSPPPPGAVVPDGSVNGSDPQAPPPAAPTPSDPCEGGEATAPGTPKAPKH